MRRLGLGACTALVALAVAAPAAAAATSSTVRLWFTSGEQFRTVTRTLPGRSGLLAPTLTALLRGPSPSELRTNFDSQIPRGVTLRSVTISAAGKADITVTPGFLKGISPAGARTADELGVLRARLGQVIYTATQFPNVRSARIIAGTTVLEGDLKRAEYNRPAAKPAPIVTPAGPSLPGARELQQRLVALGYLPAGAVDGKVGYQTQQAVLAFQSWEGLGRDGVVGPATAARLKTASRPRPSATGPARRIEVYRDRGVTLLISGGKVTRAIHTSAGAGVNATPKGRFTVFRKELRSWSVPFETWLPFASYFNAGIAFHEYADVPAYPASHGCIRVPAPDAPGVYAFASNGTTVVVI